MKIPSIVLCSAICSPLFAAGEIRHSNTNDRAEIVLGRTSNHGYAVISYLETIGDQIISLFCEMVLCARIRLLLLFYDILPFKDSDHYIKSRLLSSLGLLFIAAILTPFSAELRQKLLNYLNPEIIFTNSSAAAIYKQHPRYIDI